jgi:hypothetical protein
MQYHLSLLLRWPKIGQGEKVVPVLNKAPRHEGVLGNGGITPRIFWPRHYMEVSGQLHAQAVLPPGKKPRISISQEVRWAPGPVWTRCDEKKSQQHPIIQPVAQCYTTELSRLLRIINSMKDKKSTRLYSVSSFLLKKVCFIHNNVCCLN